MSKLHRNKYDTFIIYIFANNKENILPQSFRTLIPYSTASTWRKASSNDFIGHEFRNIQNEALEWYELFLKYQKLRTTVKIIAKVWIALASVVLPVLKKTNNEIFITQLQKLITVLPQKTVLKLTGITANSFNYKLHKLKIKCSLSPISFCMKRHPLQLAVKEVSVIKALLSNTRFTCWPVSSIAHYARRNGLLFASLSTWYKYSAFWVLKDTFLNLMTRPKVS